MDQINEILIHRLKNKGLAAFAIPGFIRDVANSISENRSIGLLEINRKMQLMGWNGIELDDHTLQLIIASSETAGLSVSKMNR